MRIAICYSPFAPPGAGLRRDKPLLSQNRQFQWYTGALSYAVYPVVMAMAATVLKKMGHEVFWMDYIAEGKSYDEFVKEFLRVKPDLAVFESKTPVIKQHWRIINYLKKKSPETKFVLCGDHVTALPLESLKNCRVDYVLGGGDYDLLIMNLVSGGFFRGEFGPKNEHQKKGNQGQTKTNLKISEKIGQIYHSSSKLILVDTRNFVKLPRIDRTLSKWRLYAYNNGNYKYMPGAYTMAGRDCWWRKPSAISNKQISKYANKFQISNFKFQIFRGCSFCSWTGIYPKWKVVKPERLLDEIEYLISLGVKEVFDDTGTFPVGEWLEKFCFGMIKRGYNRQIKFGCNMRAGVLDAKDYRLMVKAGFRLVLFGVESANNETLEKINKGVTIEQIESALRMAKEAGLSPHATIMFGYPWETFDDAKKTVTLAKKLFKEGVIDSLQATIVIPYPGTKLFGECENKGLLRTKDWDKYDMRMPIMKCPISDEKLKWLVRECYSTVLSPRFLIREIGKIRGIGDIKYLGFEAIKFFGKLGDFR